MHHHLPDPWLVSKSDLSFKPSAVVISAVLLGRLLLVRDALPKTQCSRLNVGCQLSCGLAACLTSVRLLCSFAEVGFPAGKLQLSLVSHCNMGAELASWLPNVPSPQQAFRELLRSPTAVLGCAA